MKRRLKQVKYFFRKSRRDVRGYFHRAKHGWAPQDVWHWDTYMARVMGESLKYYSETTHGWPGGDDITFEQYQALMAEAADGFLFYANHRFDYDDVDELEKRFSRSMQIVTEQWEGIWD